MLLTQLGWKVWWDKRCLETGKDWEEGFCEGLVNSRVFVPLLSVEALGSTNDLQADSRCDNVLLEYVLALELYHRRLLTALIPVHLTPLPEGLGADCVVESVTKKLKHHLDNVGFGEPVRGAESARQTLSLVMQGAQDDDKYAGEIVVPCKGKGKGKGEKMKKAEPADHGGLDAAAALIDSYLTAHGVARSFDVFLAYAPCDQHFAEVLREHLASFGVRVEGFVVQKGKGQKAKDGKPYASVASSGAPIFIPVLTAASLQPLTDLTANSRSPPALLVQMRVAVARQKSNLGFQYVVPIMLGDEDECGDRLQFGAWGQGSDEVVEAVEQEVGAMRAGAELPWKADPESGRVTLATIMNNQGFFVGGDNENYTVEVAAKAIFQRLKAKGQSDQSEQEAESLRRQLRDSQDYNKKLEMLLQQAGVQIGAETPAAGGAGKGGGAKINQSQRNKKKKKKKKRR
jgi:hypothetical protein